MALVPLGKEEAVPVFLNDLRVDWVSRVMVRSRWTVQGERLLLTAGFEVK